MAKNFLPAGVSPITGGTLAQPAEFAVSPTPVVYEPKDMTRTIIAVLTANGSIPIVTSGDFVYIKAITTPALAGAGPAMATLSVKAPIFLKPDTGPEMVIDRVGQYFRFSRKFTALQLRYPGTNLTIGLELIVGFGNFAEPSAQRVMPFFAERTITRPANVLAYAAQQYVGNTGDMGGQCLAFADVFRLGTRYSRLTRATIRKNSPTTANANFSLYLFQTPPVTAIVDQAVWAPSFPNDYYAMGRINFPSFITGGAGSAMATCDLAGIDVHLRQLDGNPQETAVYGVLVAEAAYVPTAGEALIVALWGEQLG